MNVLLSKIFSSKEYFEKESLRQLLYTFFVGLIQKKLFISQFDSLAN